MTLELEALGFSGFYKGIWDQSENEYCETREIKYGEYEDIESLLFLDDWGFGSDYRDRVAELYAKMYIGHINDTLGIDLKLVGQYVCSPKSYNYVTDKIYCQVEIDDLDALANHLRNLCNDPRYKDDLIEIIKAMHTSCSGFISFMSNKFEDWMKAIDDPQDGQYISYLIGYCANVANPISLKCLNESAYCWACEQGYHETEPQTPEAKEEWELYLKYRDLYTNWTSEHPICYPDPNHPGRHIVKPWYDYKERFMEFALAHELEVKRKAAIAAMPIIPGILDE